MRNRHDTTHDLRAIARDAMRQRGMLPDFSAEVLRETAKIDHAATMPPGAAGTALVRDLRALQWASIDNDDSRDLDQLTVAEALPDGKVKVLVAIADVDALVAKNSAIDDHARTNTTSVYTAAQIFPMLPEKLSTDLTSLGPDVDRLAVVIEYTVADDGALADGDVYRALVHNQAKLAYNSVAAWLEDGAAPPAAVSRVPGLDRQLQMQDATAQRLRAVRHAQGALRLETIEARPVFDGETLVDLQPDRKNRAKELIEDFMVAANGVTARYLARKDFPTLRRVLKTPKRWDRIVVLAAELGTKLPAAPDSAALDAFLDARRRADPLRFPDVSLSVVKLLGSGEYALEAPGHSGEGHFGLAVRDYNHSTAPNRRFPDLVAQRLLKAAMSGRPAPYSNEELTALARHCTVQEDNAAKVERQVRKSAAALLLEHRIGERFDAIVTGASDKGTYVRIAGPTVEGRVVRGEHGMDVGDQVRVELASVDVERGFIDFFFAGRAGGQRQAQPQAPLQSKHR